MSTEELKESLRKIESKVDSLLQSKSPESKPSKKVKREKTGEKRAPSAYNTFVKEKIAELRREEEQRGGEKMGHKEIFKLAAQAWTKERGSQDQQ